MEEEEDASALGGLDLAVLVGYFLLIAGVSVAVSRHQASSEGSRTESYFLAERSVAWWAVAASLFASNIGSEHFIGLAGGAAKLGVVVGWFEVGAIPVVLLTGAFFLPTYLWARVQTTPDYLERRYNLYCRTLIVCVSLAVYVFSKVSATLFAGEIILVELIHVNKLVAVVLLVTFTAIYTILGGLEAVIYTEALQTLVLLFGGFLVLARTLDEVGGWQGLEAALGNESDVEENFLHFFRPSSDPEYPWTGFAFGFYVIAPWYWGIDQVIVQRALAAKDIAHGQMGCTAAAMLKFLPFFMMVVPGLCARVIIERRLSTEELAEFNFDHSYPWLVLNVIPRNSRGIIVASMLSSLMSALASVFNSSATLFALNIWKQLYPSTDEKRLVFIGRITVVVLAILSVLWLPVMPYLGSSLYIITQKPPSFVAPPILSLYFWGMLSSVPNARGGALTLSVGIGVGTLRFLLEVIEDVRGVKMFGPFTAVNFLHFAAISFWASTALLFGSSYLYRRTGGGSLETGHGGKDGGVDTSLHFAWSLFDRLMARQYGHRPVPDLDFDDTLSELGLEPDGGADASPVGGVTEVELSRAHSDDRSSEEGSSGLLSPDGRVGDAPERLRGAAGTSNMDENHLESVELSELTLRDVEATDDSDAEASASVAPAPIGADPAGARAYRQVTRASSLPEPVETWDPRASPLLLRRLTIRMAMVAVLAAWAVQVFHFA